jgi:hypothetical protein
MHCPDPRLSLVRGCTSAVKAVGSEFFFGELVDAGFVVAGKWQVSVNGDVDTAGHTWLWHN